jgi:polysaccharide biosynthesis transport protein
MEARKFFNILKKHRWGLLVIPVLVCALVFFLTRNLPDSYSSKARISSGITEKSRQFLQAASILQESKINQDFSNLLQTMQLKVVTDQVSYRLILHELTSKIPFRKPSKLMKQLTPEAKAHALEVYSKNYAERRSLDLLNKDEYGLNEVLKSMGFDGESLKKKVKVYRVENSDYIDIEYESENAELSAFLVNTLASEFIDYYGSLTQENEKNAILKLADILKHKKDTLDMNMERLRDYKIKNRVLNLDEQAKILYSQIADFETRLNVAQKEVDANRGAIREIDAKFSENEKQYMDHLQNKINKEIVYEENQLNSLNDQYIRDNFNNPAVADAIETLKKSLAQKIKSAADKYVSNPLGTKDALISQKMKLQVDLGLAQNSIGSLREVINNLYRRLDNLVPNEAVIQGYESEISVEDQEYVELLKRYNQSYIDFNNTVHLKLLEAGEPGPKQAAKKMILVVAGGAVTAIVYIFILFIIFYLDQSVIYPADLYNKTGMPVLGAIPILKTNMLDIQKMWMIEPSNNLLGTGNLGGLIKKTKKDIQKIAAKKRLAGTDDEFKRLLRSSRFEIAQAMGDANSIVITSLGSEEGKTLISLSLASAYHFTNKRVLLIDGNFLHSGITELTKPTYFIEDYIQDKISAAQIAEEKNICILGNKGKDITLFEIRDKNYVLHKLHDLKDFFDIVLIEASGLNTFNHSKEWVVVADKVLCVYEANTAITLEQKTEVEYLRQMNGKFVGWVLNKVTEPVVV